MMLIFVLWTILAATLALLACFANYPAAVEAEAVAPDLASMEEVSSSKIASPVVLNHPSEISIFPYASRRGLRTGSTGSNAISADTMKIQANPQVQSDALCELTRLFSNWPKTLGSTSFPTLSPTAPPSLSPTVSVPTMNPTLASIVGWGCDGSSSPAVAFNYPCGPSSSTWTGVSCSGGAVNSQYPLHLDLSGLGLIGTLGTQISLLSFLETLNLNSNFFSSSIPLSITSMTSLVNLDLSQNKLTGILPTGLSQLTRLTTLNLNNNLLDGPVPAICMISLTTLNLKVNNFNCIKTCTSTKAGLSNRDTNTPVGDGCTFPTSQPSRQPSSQPSVYPTNQPSRRPSMHPTSQPTMQPSHQPSMLPSSQPSRQPTSQPSSQPSRLPTSQPSLQPTSQPTMQPSRQPSRQPSSQPSRLPTSQPSSLPSQQPSSQPSLTPTVQPSRQPTCQPSRQPLARPSSLPSTQPSLQPSRQPSRLPTSQPSSQPTRLPSSQPSRQPSRQPSSQPLSRPSGQPSKQPFMRPSAQPSSIPTRQPSLQPLSYPTMQPTMQPSRNPNSRPSNKPSRQPSTQPTRYPTCIPSYQPSCRPTLRPSSHPSTQPFSYPTMIPSMQPSMQPSCQPLLKPSAQPTRQPSSQPSSQPTSKPSSQPSRLPSSQPSHQPSRLPSSQPSSLPSSQPSMRPSHQPSSNPTYPTSQPTRQPTSNPSNPSSQPSAIPSDEPSMQPTAQPSMSPISRPSSQPSRQPTRLPSMQPSRQPTSQPSLQPFCHPTMQPSRQPSQQPSSQPTRLPSSQPSILPTSQPTKRPSNQPSSMPSRPTGLPSGRPSICPSSQPTTAPSEIILEWHVNVTRLDDFLDPFDNSNSNIKYNLQQYCTNNRWRVIKLSNGALTPNPDCSLRLALQYCAYYRPWYNSMTADQFSCKIFVPYSINKLELNSVILDFLSTADKKSMFKYLPNSDASRSDPVTVSIDFQGSVVTLKKDFEIWYGSNIFSLTMSNVKFISNLSSSPLSSSSSSSPSSPSSSSSSSDVETVDAVAITMNGIYEFNLDRVQIVPPVYLNLNKVEMVRLSNVNINNSYLQNYGNRNQIVRANNVTISSSSFYNNSAVVFGGVFCLSRVTSLRVLDCDFVHNSAKYGSALALHRVSEVFFSSNRFHFNNASAAGTIYWIYDSVYMPFAPVIPFDLNSFIGNKAALYGPDIASSFFDLEARYNVNSILVNDYTSGAFTVNVTYSTNDAHGQIIPYEGLAVIASAPPQIGNYAFNCAGNIPKLFGDLSLFLINGSVYFDRLGVICAPSGSTPIIFVTKGIVDYTNLYAMTASYQVKKLLPVFFRTCVRGEIFDLNSITRSTCSICRDSFSTDDNLNGVLATTCSLCPRNALQCYADTILLKEGTWRYNHKTVVIWECTNYHACLGGLTAGKSGCAVGYHGPLCGLCKNGYFMDSSNACNKCLSGRAAVLAIVLRFLRDIISFIGIYYVTKFLQKFVKAEHVACIGVIITNYQTVVLSSGLGSSSTNTKSNSPQGVSTFTSTIVQSLSFLKFKLASFSMISCYASFDYFSSLRLQIYLVYGAVICLFIVKGIFRLRHYFFGTPYVLTEMGIDKVLISIAFYTIFPFSTGLLASYNCIDLNPNREDWGGLNDPDMVVSSIGYSFLLTDTTINCGSDYYKNNLAWVSVLVVMLPIGVPVLLFYLLQQSSDLLSSNGFNSLRNKVSTVIASNLTVGRKYVMIEPLSAIYESHKAKYWFIGVRLLVIRLCMTSVIGTFVTDPGQLVMINIVIALYLYRFQIRNDPAKSAIENRVMELGCLQVLVCYIGRYVYYHNCLEPFAWGYFYLDIVLSLSNVAPVMALFHDMIPYAIKQYKEEKIRKEAEKLKEIMEMKELKEMKDETANFTIAEKLRAANRSADDKLVLLDLDDKQSNADIKLIAAIFTLRLLSIKLARYKIKIERSGSRSSSSSSSRSSSKVVKSDDEIALEAEQKLLDAAAVLDPNKLEAFDSNINREVSSEFFTRNIDVSRREKFFFATKKQQRKPVKRPVDDPHRIYVTNKRSLTFDTIDETDDMYWQHRDADLILRRFNIAEFRIFSFTKSGSLALYEPNDNIELARELQPAISTRYSKHKEDIENKKRLHEEEVGRKLENMRLDEAHKQKQKHLKKFLASKFAADIRSSRKEEKDAQVRSMIAVRALKKIPRSVQRLRDVQNCVDLTLASRSKSRRDSEDDWLDADPTPFKDSSGSEDKYFLSSSSSPLSSPSSPSSSSSSSASDDSEYSSKDYLQNFNSEDDYAHNEPTGGYYTHHSTSGRRSYDNDNDNHNHNGNNSNGKMHFHNTLNAKPKPNNLITSPTINSKSNSSKINYKNARLPEVNDSDGFNEYFLSLAKEAISDDSSKVVIREAQPSRGGAKLKSMRPACATASAATAVTAAAASIPFSTLNNNQKRREKIETKAAISSNRSVKKVFGQPFPTPIAKIDNVNNIISSSKNNNSNSTKVISTAGAALTTRAPILQQHAVINASTSFIDKAKAPAVDKSTTIQPAAIASYVEVSIPAMEKEKEKKKKKKSSILGRINSKLISVNSTASHDDFNVRDAFPTQSLVRSVLLDDDDDDNSTEIEDGYDINNDVAYDGGFNSISINKNRVRNAILTTGSASTSTNITNGIIGEDDRTVTSDIFTILEEGSAVTLSSTDGRRDKNTNDNNIKIGDQTDSGFVEVNSQTMDSTTCNNDSSSTSRNRLRKAWKPDSNWNSGSLSLLQSALSNTTNSTTSTASTTKGGSYNLNPNQKLSKVATKISTSAAFTTAATTATATTTTSMDLLSHTRTASETTATTATTATLSIPPIPLMQNRRQEGIAPSTIERYNGSWDNSLASPNPNPNLNANAISNPKYASKKQKLKKKSNPATQVPAPSQATLAIKSSANSKLRLSKMSRNDVPDMDLYSDTLIASPPMDLNHDDLIDLFINSNKNRFNNISESKYSSNTNNNSSSNINSSYSNSNSNSNSNSSRLPNNKIAPNTGLISLDQLKPKETTNWKNFLSILDKNI